MYALRIPRLSRLVLVCTVAAIAFAMDASATTATVDPELEKQEREVERLLKSAEAEFWSLKQRLERDRNDRALRLAQAKADYEKAQQVTEATASKSATADRTVAAHKADVALEKYQTELERALTGVDSARAALDRVEARVSQYRAALEALRRRTRGANQQSTPAQPDSTAARTPTT